MQGSKLKRRPDVVIFINGLPMAVIELKNSVDENADIWDACNQLQTHKGKANIMAMSWHTMMECGHSTNEPPEYSP